MASNSWRTTTRVVKRQRSLRGAVPAPSVRQLARKSDVIISCLPNDEAVLSVYQGPEGVLACANPGTVVIEMSTVSPDTSRLLHRMGLERKIEVLDVAISGSTPAAEQGILTLLCGGDANVFEACQPIFSAIAKQYFHLGPSGSGTSMKLVVNALLGVNMQAIAEAVAFGEKAGLNRELLLEVLAKTAVVSRAHQNKLLRAEHDDYSPQFPLKLMNKDFRLILDKASRTRRADAGNRSRASGQRRPYGGQWRRGFLERDQRDGTPGAGPR